MAAALTTSIGLLTINQVAESIGLDILAASRLVANGTLPSSRIGTSGPWVVFPDKLAAFISSSGSKPLDMPPLDAAGAWFQPSYVSIANAKRFEADVQAAMQSVLPAAPPKDSLGGLQVSNELSAAANAIKSLAAAKPLPPTIRMPGQPDANPFPTRGAEYVALQLQDALQTVARPTANEMQHGIPTPLVKLFAFGPDQYRNLMNAAWAMVIQRNFVTNRTYQVADPIPRHFMAHFAVPYTAMGITLNQVEPLAI